MGDCEEDVNCCDIVDITVDVAGIGTNGGSTVDWEFTLKEGMDLGG